MHFTPQNDTHRGEKPESERRSWNYTGALKSAVSSSDDRRQTREWSERLQLRDKLSRAIKGEVLHSQRDCLFPFAGSQPFIHWNICTSHRLQQGIHPLLKSQHLHGETNERTGGEGGSADRTNLLQRCALFIHMASLENLRALLKVWGIILQFFFPLNESLFLKSLKTERNCYLVPHKRIWCNRGIPSSSGQHEHWCSEVQTEGRIMLLVTKTRWQNHWRLFVIDCAFRFFSSILSQMSSISKSRPSQRVKRP